MRLFLTTIMVRRADGGLSNEVYVQSHPTGWEALGSALRQVREKFPNDSVISEGQQDISDWAREYARNYPE